MTSEALINHRMNGGEWLALLLLSVLWGGSFFFAAVLIKTLPPFTIVFLRVGLAAVILNVLVRALGMRMPGTRTAWLAFSGMGLLNNALPFWLIVWGQSHIASGLAAIDGRLLGRIWRLACSNLIKPAPQNYRPPSSRRPFQK